MRACPRLIAHASGVDQTWSSGRLVGAPRSSSSASMSGRLFLAAHASGVDRLASGVDRREGRRPPARSPARRLAGM